MSIDYKKYFFNFCWFIFVSIKLLAQNTSNYLLKNAKKNFNVLKQILKNNAKNKLSAASSGLTVISNLAKPHPSFKPSSTKASPKGANLPLITESYKKHLAF